MNSIFKLFLVAVLVFCIIRPVPVRAEQVVRIIKNSELDFTSSKDFSGASRVVPRYGGSDDSGFAVNFFDDCALIPLIKLNLSQADADQGAIVGMVECRSISECGLVLCSQNRIASSVILPCSPDDQSSFKFFKLPVPGGFVAGQLTLSFQSPKSMNNYSSVAFANVRLVHGEPSKSTAVPTPPMPIDGGSTLATKRSIPTVLREFSGNDFEAHLLMGGDMKPKPLDLMGTAGAAVFVAPVGVLRSIPILAVDDPPITSSSYAITGQVTYAGVNGHDDVDGYGYLEMWSEFADGSSYFTRTLSAGGPLRQIRGRSGPRPFVLPFNSADKRPTRIRMNLVMSDRGSVSWTDLKLVQYLEPVAATTGRADRNALFNPRLLWMPVAVLPMFALISLMEPLVRRGKGRSFVLVWTWIFFALAQFSIAWGMAAWGHGLSIREVGPMLFASCVILGCTLFTVPRMSRRYRDAELRKMQLMDIV